MELICQYCNKDFETVGIRDSSFCSDACRYAYHNEARKIERLERAILAKMDTLRAIINQKNSLSYKALASVDKIANEVDTMPNRKYKCRNCGQIAMLKPATNEKCSYCMEADSYYPIISKFKA